MLLQIIGKYKITEKVTTFAPTRNIFFKTGEQRAVCNNPPLAVGLGKAFHLLTENGKPADKKSSAGQLLHTNRKEESGYGQCIGAANL